MKNNNNYSNTSFFSVCIQHITQLLKYMRGHDKSSLKFSQNLSCFVCPLRATTVNRTMEGEGRAERGGVQMQDNQHVSSRRHRLLPCHRGSESAAKWCHTRSNMLFTYEQYTCKHQLCFPFVFFSFALFLCIFLQESFTPPVEGREVKRGLLYTWTGAGGGTSVLCANACVSDSEHTTQKEKSSKKEAGKTTFHQVPQLLLSMHPSIHPFIHPSAFPLHLSLGSVTNMLLLMSDISHGENWLEGPGTLLPKDLPEISGPRAGRYFDLDTGSR